MEAVALYKGNYHVDYGDADYFKKLKLSSLFNYLQDIGNLHSQNLGISINDIREEHGVTWVMVRILVEIERMPNFNEDITVETWPNEPKKMEFVRNYIIRDREENILVRAIASWVIIDVVKREIRKTDLLNTKYPPFIESKAIDRGMSKLKANGELAFIYSKQIGYSDIDLNGHLNNSKYVDYITDCFSMHTHEKYTAESIQINYVNEALAGDTIDFYKDVSNLESGFVYIEGVDKLCQKVYFRACILLK
jgi:acyl-ACP thioesterase